MATDRQLTSNPNERPTGPPFTIGRYDSFGECLVAERDWLQLENERIKRTRDQEREYDHVLYENQQLRDALREVVKHGPTSPTNPRYNCFTTGTTATIRMYEAASEALANIDRLSDETSAKLCPKCNRTVTSGCNYCACPYPQPTEEKPAVSADQDCPTGDWKHRKFKGKCLYCGAPMPEATPLKAFVQLCAPHGKDWLTCPECAKAAVNGASDVAR